jgi:hypothetical protein
MRRRLTAILFLLTFVAGSPLRAQDAPAPLTPPPAQDTTRKLLSPGGAFFRSVVVPGWGQGSVGAYKRGGVFFAIQSASYYMLFKTLARLDDAREKETRRVAFVSDTLRLAMAQDTTLARELADPIAFMERVGTDPTVAAVRSLIESREQQRQDWITYTIFFTMASGLDALIAAQLADFPAAIITRPAPAGGVQLQVHVPWPRRP